MALFDTPCGIAIDPQGNLLVADTANHRIRKITPQGEVVTIAGRMFKDDYDTAERPQIDSPAGIAVTHDGFVFITDRDGGRIWRITPEGDASIYAGVTTGFEDKKGMWSSFNSPSGIAVDRGGNLYVADSQNYLIRMVWPKFEAEELTAREVFVQPATASAKSDADSAVPRLDRVMTDITNFPWPLAPQQEWHEVTGVVGEARGAPGGIALAHLHSGLDIRGAQGEAALSVLDEKVSAPLPNWDAGGSGEGIHVGLMSYIHVRVGRNAKDETQRPDIFKIMRDDTGRVLRVRVRRGTRFKVGDFIGTLNHLNHVHLNFGPWNAQANPLRLPLPGFRDTIAPTIEENGIEIITEAIGRPREVFSKKMDGRLVISGDVRIVMTAYDRADGNLPGRKLGLYRAGYQILNEDGSPVQGYETPLMNIDFNRLPPDDGAVFLTYDVGSGVSAYGTPTRFRYILTNRVRDGDAVRGLLRTASLAPGDYLIRVFAEDLSGNRTTAEVAVRRTP